MLLSLFPHCLGKPLDRARLPYPEERPEEDAVASLQQFPAHAVSCPDERSIEVKTILMGVRHEDWFCSDPFVDCLSVAERQQSRNQHGVGILLYRDESACAAVL